MNRMQGSLLTQAARWGSFAGFFARTSRDGQEMDKSASSPIHRPADLLPELVELMGIEPMTS
jgi:hypothetical protein